MKSKGLLLGVLLAAAWALVDVYSVVYAESWVVQSFGRFAMPVIAILVFVPKFVSGICAGVVARMFESRSGAGGLSIGTLLALAIYFAWRFFELETLLAPDLFTCVLAVGPYVAFFAGFLVPEWIGRGKGSVVER